MSDFADDEDFGELGNLDNRPVWSHDQAAGLRNLFKVKQSTGIAFMSTAADVGKTRLVARIGLALASPQSSTLLIDELGTDLFSVLGTGFRFDLVKALNGDLSLEQVLVSGGEHLKLLPAAKAVAQFALQENEGRRRLGQILAPTWRNQSFVLVDAQVMPSAGHPLSILSRAVNYVVLVVMGGVPAMTSSFQLVKRLAATMPNTQIQVIVSRCRSEDDALTVYANLAAATAQHLGVEIHWLGWLPADTSWRGATVSAHGCGLADQACETMASALRRMVSGQQGGELGLSSLGMESELGGFSAGLG